MARGNEFTPLTLDLIEEGSFREAIERALADAQGELVRHVDKWEERAGKAKAEVNISIKFTCESTKDGVYSIEPTLKVKTPARPPRITAAFGGPLTRNGETTGEMALFVRGSGSTAGDPFQTHVPFDTEGFSDEVKAEAEGKSEA